jgi:hypothetical protein
MGEIVRAGLYQFTTKGGVVAVGKNLSTAVDIFRYVAVCVIGAGDDRSGKRPHRLASLADRNAPSGTVRPPFLGERKVPAIYGEFMKHDHPKL